MEAGPVPSGRTAARRDRLARAVRGSLGVRLDACHGHTLTGRAVLPVDGRHRNVIGAAAKGDRLGEVHGGRPGDHALDAGLAIHVDVNPQRAPR